MVSIKLSHRLIIVESVNTQWVLFSLEINLCYQLTGSANNDKSVNCVLMSLNIPGPYSIHKKVCQCGSKGCGREPHEPVSLGTFSKVGSFGQLSKIMAVDIRVVNTMKKPH